MRTCTYANDNFELLLGAIKGLLSLVLVTSSFAFATVKPCETWLVKQQDRIARNIHAIDEWESAWDLHLNRQYFGSNAKGSSSERIRALTLDLLDQKIRNLGERSSFAANVAFDPPGRTEDYEDATSAMQDIAIAQLSKWIEADDTIDDASEFDSQLNETDVTSPPNSNLEKALLRTYKNITEFMTTSWLRSRPNEEDLNFQCPSYHTIRNLVHFHLESQNPREWSVAESFAYIHEVEHAIMTHSRIWNSKFIPDFVKRWRHKLEVYRIQFERDIAEYWRVNATSPILRNIAGYLISKEEIPAIGAQWELASRIPQEVRADVIVKLEKEIKEIQQGDSSYARGNESAEKQIRLKTAIEIRRIAIESLRRAHLDKYSFVLQMLPFQNYSASDFLKR